MELYNINTDELAANAVTKVSVVLVLDASSSMNQNDAVNQLNQGVEFLGEALLTDKIAKHSVELAIVTFADKAEVHLDFTPISDEPFIPKILGDGLTSMGEAIELAMGILEERKNYYKSTSQHYYQPMMILLTDGMATDDISTASKLTKKAESEGKLTLFAIGCGKGIDESELKRLSNRDMIIGVQSPKYFQDMFEWISNSIKAITSSQIGDKITLPPLPTEGFDVRT